MQQDSGEAFNHRALRLQVSRLHCCPPLRLFQNGVRHANPAMTRRVVGSSPPLEDMTRVQPSFRTGWGAMLIMSAGQYLEW